MLRENDRITVYHKIDDEGNHCYYFYDGKKNRIGLVRNWTYSK
jgi:hypothetical protein